jgi:hypothetical protein
VSGMELDRVICGDCLDVMGEMDARLRSCKDQLLQYGGRNGRAL